MLLRRVDSIVPPNDSLVTRDSDTFQRSRERRSVFAAQHDSALLAFRTATTIMLIFAAQYHSAVVQVRTATAMAPCPREHKCACRY